MKTTEPHNFSRHWKRTAARLPTLGNISVLIFLSVLPALAQLRSICGTNEHHHLDRALGAMNMTTEDLAFDKDHGEPKAVLPWCRDALNDPLLLIPRLGAWLLDAAEGKEGVMDFHAIGSFLLDPRGTALIRFNCFEGSLELKGLDPQLARAVGIVHQAVMESGIDEVDVFRNLSAEEKQWLAATAMSDLMTVGRAGLEPVLRGAGVSTSVIERVRREEAAFDPEPATTNFIAVAARVDRTALLHAGWRFQAGVAALAKSAAAVTNWPTSVMRFETKFGPIIILPDGNHSVTGSALLVLSRSGNTTYHSPQPSGSTGSIKSLPPGAANALLGQPLAAIIDLGGNDTYLGENSVGPGGALFGVSVIYDAAGDDVYKSSYLGDGAAVFGVSWVEDVAGDDKHEAQGFAQGAAVNGFAMLRDHAGKDSYSVGMLGQGVAGFMGFGLLVDDAGRDRYRAGGSEKDWGRGGGQFLSLSQGFSIGIRGFAGGGVGALVDRAGDDTYIADVYGQGSSYWYSAGLLVDAGGNDTYTAHQYVQGAGIHLSVGMLADLGGNDRYTGQILSQGAGHDYGVGLLFEHGGNDTYSGDHHTQGRALNNGLGVLVDSAGDDSYTAKQPNRAQGIGNNGDNREYGSIAILADLDGTDSYSCGAQNNARLLRPLFGVVYDHSTNAPWAQGGVK